MSGYSSFEGENAKMRKNFEGSGKVRPGVKPVVMVLLAVVMACAAGMAAGRRSSPARAVAREVSANGDVLRSTLKNGLRVVVVRDTLAPVVTTVVNYRVGSNEAPEGFPGMAHALEHMMFRGSPGLDANQLADISAAMGGDSNADTQQTVTQYFFTVPSEDLDVALHIESIRMSAADNSDKEWAQERGAIEQEVAQDLSNPEYVFYTKLLQAMYRGTPYAHDALGTRPSFDTTTGAMLRDFYNTWYAPNNAILVIAGDVEPQAVLAKVKQLFGDIPSKKLPERPAVNLQPVAARTLQLPTDLPYGLALISFRMPGYGDKDFAAAEILSDVLSSQRGTLYALVPEGKALFAGFSIEGLPGTGLGYAIAAFPKGADTATLVKQVNDILAEDVKNGLPADLVEAAKRREAAEAEFRRNSIAGLAMSWSDALAIKGLNSPDEDVEAIMKVTPEDVNRVARQYLSFDHAITAVLSPQPSGKPISSKSFGGRESFAPSETKAVELPVWAKTALARLDVPESTVHPVVTKLPNGLKLIVQPESVSDTVSVYGDVRNNPDLETPPQQEGVDGVLSDLFSYGTESLDRIAYQKALDDIAADESAGTRFSVSVLADHFDRGVELLADNVLHPALPEKAFVSVQRQNAAAVAGQLESPDFLTSLAINAALFPATDPSLRKATPQTVMSLKLADVRNYYSHVFRPDLTTIVVIGKVTPEVAQKAIEKYFGSWTATGPAPRTDYPAVPENNPSATNVPDQSRVQDQVTLAQTVTMTRFSPDYYPLELGNHVLGGGFYATRLYRDLREKHGLVYYVGVSLGAGRTRSVYSVSYACDPPNVSKARAIVVRNLTEMQTTPVGPSELRQAKALLLREIPLGESSTGRIAGGLLSRATIGLPLDEPTVAAHRYMGLTAAQVQAAFKKWVRPGDLAQVVEGPKPQ
jgi:zinc protease